MKVTIAAIGKWKASPERTLFEEYCKRTPWKISLIECEEKKSLTGPQRKEREGELLLAGCKGAEKIIALDEKGKALTSPALAQQLSAWQGQGIHHLAFVIGGADGLSAAVLKAAQLTLCFGALTWPHMLVRAMLAEQLYRAHTILAGHPYHRT